MSRICEISNCNFKATRKKVCNKHYYILYRKEYNRQYYINNREKLDLFQKNNKENHYKSVKKYRETDKGKLVTLKSLKNYRNTIRGKRVRCDLEMRREAEKLKRTPKWADLVKIRQFYLNCPQDYEVDHIIPLQGKNVSGLHVEYNLQYLTKSENRKKWNKYE